MFRKNPIVKLIYLYIHVHPGQDRLKMFSLIKVVKENGHKDMNMPFVTVTLHITYSRYNSTLIFHPNPIIS